MLSAAGIQRAQLSPLLNDFLQPADQRLGFGKTRVHALNADRAGLMGRVANEPTAILAARFRQTALKSNLCAPGDIFYAGCKPGSALAADSFYILSDELIHLRLRQAHRPAFFFRELGRQLMPQ